MNSQQTSRSPTTPWRSGSESADEVQTVTTATGEAGAARTAGQPSPAGSRAGHPDHADRRPTIRPLRAPDAMRSLGCSGGPRPEADGVAVKLRAHAPASAPLRSTPPRPATHTRRPEGLVRRVFRSLTSLPATWRRRVGITTVITPILRSCALPLASPRDRHADVVELQDGPLQLLRLPARRHSQLDVQA